MLENEGATAEVEELNEIAQDEPKSMDDTIRDTLRNLQNREENTELKTESTPQSPEEKAQKIRDDQGKFAKTNEPTQTAQPLEVEQVTPAPNTWKKEAAQEWAKLPPVIRAEVEKREADFHRGIEGYKQKAEFAQSIERAITPYSQTLQSLNIAPEKAISELMAADHRLRYGSPSDKSAYFAQLAQSYGIDLATVAPVEQQYIDPNISHLQKQVQELSGFIQQQQLMGQQQAQESLNSEISSFAADPKHSHFESVKGHMSALLQAGQAKDLAEAYEQAVYANPTTRVAMLAEQQAVQRAEAAIKAQAAKKAASINVRSRPTMPVSQPIGSMDDTIRSTLRRLQGS